MKRCILFFLLILFGCSQKKKIEVQRSFYYWKSVFQLSPLEHAVLDSFSVQKLYVKFFDVEWNSQANAAFPISQIQFKDSLSTAINIVPTVFITNETLQYINGREIDTLAQKIIRLIKNISIANALRLFPEIQIDCDWTAGTKEKYFQLLKLIRKQPFLDRKKISATIRLHQLKFVRQTGIPPVDRGLLMCYNMGDLYNPQIKNSILDTDELEKYIGSLKKYPLKLDIALPIFDWYVWFRNKRFKGLIRTGNIDGKFSKEKKIIFKKDSSIKGYSFEKGDWLRYEFCDIKSIEEAASLIREKLPYNNLTVVLYHLDDSNLSKYSTHEMEDIFKSFE